jgi:hypothetical protein
MVRGMSRTKGRWTRSPPTKLLEVLRKVQPEKLSAKPPLSQRNSRCWSQPAARATGGSEARSRASNAEPFHSWWPSVRKSKQTEPEFKEKSEKAPRASR